MEILNTVLDWLYYDVIAPFFTFLVRMMDGLFLAPLGRLGTPEWLQVVLAAILTVTFAFWLRRVFKVDERIAVFRAAFVAKREKQMDLQMVSDKYSREALYRSTDEELNHDFNIYLAQHYARYVSIYLLPLFLSLAWLNRSLSEEWLTAQYGAPFVLPAPVNSMGVEGLSVTFVFLVTYVISLIIGFNFPRLRRRLRAVTP